MFLRLPGATLIAAVLLGALGLVLLSYAIGLRRLDIGAIEAWFTARNEARARRAATVSAPRAQPAVRTRAKRAPIEPMVESVAAAPSAAPLVKAPRAPGKASEREQRESQKAFDFVQPGGFHLPELAMLAKPKPRSASFDEDALRQNARMLEAVLAEFGVRGQVDQIRRGPVVTLYELVPAAGVKSARVVALSDDIARSMSVAACRVSVVAGRNAIGIEWLAQRPARDRLSARPAVFQ